MKQPRQRVEFEYRVAIKKLGFAKHLYRSSKQANGTYLDEFGDSKPRMMELVHFMDTQTLACALLGPGPTSMKALLNRLNVPKKFQKETADYHGQITFEYIDYCRSDVENTWQLFKGCRELYRQQNLPTAMHKLYSGASLGKAYERRFGIEGFNKLNPAFDPIVLGCIMEGYYGGQSDVRIRHMIVEVIHCDFKSQYPTVNVLMGLQELLIADQIGVRRDDPEARRFLETVGLNDLQKKETWRKLRGVALIVPDDDDLPYRTKYGETEDGSITVNIGVNRVISACPAWYTFADIIKTKLLTGRTPKILKTLELYPIGQQRTEIIKLFGDDRYEVDLSKDDLFRTMIDVRIDIENERDNELTPDDRKAFLDSFQNGLKTAANAASYGVPNEFIVDDHLAEVPTTVYFGGMSAKVKARAHSVGIDGDEEISDYKAEKAGGFYSPLGVLIPAAGRLLLGIAERLAGDRGLTYAFCDTDSMAFCDYLQKYTTEEFRMKVQEITDWFQPLNPYKHDVRLFGFEKVNFRLKDFESGKTAKEWEPLYCLAVSAKRYCLFNLDKDGLPIIRKASAHGLGDVMLPIGYRARFEHLGAPIKTGADLKDEPNNVNTRKHGKLVAGSAAPLFLDMWYTAIEELREKGTLDGIDKVICAWPELAAPQHCQTSLSTRDAWLHYQNLPNRRAFQFFETLPAPILTFQESAADPEIMWAEMQQAEKSSLYTAYSKPFELDFDNLYRRDTNELIKPYLDEGMRLTTVADRVRGYFAHGEAKSEGSVGLLKRKSVIGLSKAWIGKESHPYADVEDLPDDETMEAYKAGVEIIEAGLNHDLIARAGVTEIAKAARIDEDLLVDVVMGRRGLRPDLLARLQQAISVDTDGKIKVLKVPITKLETDAERVEGLLRKGKLFRELGKFIHATKCAERDAVLKLEHPDDPRPPSHYCDVTHKDILKDLDNVMSRVPPKFLKLAEIETYAKKFYGIEARLAKKSDRKAKQAEWFKTTAHNARARRDNLRTKGRGNEIKRVAEFWGLQEIASVKTVRHAHLLDQSLTEIAATGAVPIEFVCGPYLGGVSQGSPTAKPGGVANGGKAPYDVASE